MPVVLIRSTSASTALMVGMLFSPRCISTTPSTTSLSASCPAMPSRGRLPILTLPMSFTSTGAPLTVVTRVWPIWSTLWIRPTPRTMAAWEPKLMVWPPTLTLALFSACSSCGRLTP